MFTHCYSQAFRYQIITMRENSRGVWLFSSGATLRCETFWEPEDNQSYFWSSHPESGKKKKNNPPFSAGEELLVQTSRS